MRLLITLFYLLTSLSSFAGQPPQKGKPVIHYRIVADTIDTTIPKGKCVIYGTVKFGNELLENALVATCDSRLRTRTNKKGKYEITITDQDSCLYMFIPSYDEIITRMHDFKSQHRVHIEFTATQNIMILEVDKPVIYVYAEDETECKLNLEPRSELTFTYPKYDSGWSFSTHPTGNVLVNGEYYPYLFWEGETTKLEYKYRESRFINAFQIKADTVIPFLETQLENLGLNDREKTDFITFWAPRMITQEYALVQFMWDEEYSKTIADLNMSPQPESSRRFFMFFSGMDEYSEDIGVVAPQYPKFERKGLTLIEWGGSELLMPKTPM